MSTRVVDETFAARHDTAVIRVVENDGIFQQSRVFQFIDPVAHIAIHFVDAGVVGGYSLANSLSIRQIGGNADLFQRNLGFDRVAGRVQAAFVRQVGIENGEKGLSFGTVFPVGISAALIPTGSILIYVVILLAIVSGIE